MIEVSHLTKTYGPSRGISDISFEVKSGEILGFLGPNGAGKSTTMRILTCSTPATSGSVRVAGFDVSKDPIEVKKKLGYLPETPPVYTDMTVRQYLEYAGKLHGMNSKELAPRIQWAADRCSLTEVLHRLIGNLSKGFRQRVGIAQALLHDPKVLILDEPTVGLDPHQIIEIRKLIKDLAGERTIILSTHILPEVQATCQRVIIINKGVIAASGTLDELEGKMSKTQKVQLTLERMLDTTFQKLKDHESVKSSSAPRKDGVGLTVVEFEVNHTNEARRRLGEIAVNDGCGLLELRANHLSLEDLFVRLTTRGEA